MGSELEHKSLCHGSDSLVKEESLNMIEIGSEKFGCSHYRRRCKIRAPCCDEIFDCRHCHNEAKNALDIDPLHRHDIPRREVKKVICSLCSTEQDVQQNCISCGVSMGKYFCPECKFFDDDVSKNQYHCDECGICRIPAVGFPALVPGHCLPAHSAQLTPVESGSSFTTKRRQEKSGKSGSKRARK